MRSIRPVGGIAAAVMLLASGWTACSLTAPSDGELMGGGSAGSIHPDGSVKDTSLDGLGTDGVSPDGAKDAQPQDSGGDKAADHVSDLSTDPIGDGKASDADGDSTTNCAPGTKSCLNQCVPTDQPTTGCGSPDCQPCSFAHASAMCDSNLDCKMEKCVLGYGDCNASANDGCEVNLQADPFNCNTCANVCPSGAGVAICTAGVCGISNCAAGTGNCDSDDANGCETDLLSSTGNCGACGNPCSFTNGTAVCENGSCKLTGCLPGSGNCDGNDSNGCETDITTSLSHCGTCGNACEAPANATATCASSTCGFACMSPYQDCDTNAANGCEANMLTDEANCGQCGNACAAPLAPSCQNGACDCPPMTGTQVIAGPHFLYGFCWYLTAGGRTCDNACLSLGGTNRALAAQNSFPDSCSAPTAGDLSTWFFQNGNPGGWPANPLATTRKTFGHGAPTKNYVGKCSIGTATSTGTYPGDPNGDTSRNLVCPCF